MNLLSVPKQLVEIVFELISLLVYIVYLYSAKLFRVFVSRPLKSLDGEVILVSNQSSLPCKIAEHCL